MIWGHPLRSLRGAIDQYPRTARTVIVFAVVGLNVLGFLRLQDKRNPASTLERAAEAIRERDSSAFEVEADVESIAASYYDQHLLPKRIEQGTASVPGVRERDKNAVARRLRRWIETGRIDDSEPPRLTLLGDFVRSALDARAATVQEIRPAHNIAIAVADLGDRYGIHATLEIKLTRQQGFWRITEVTNVEELVHDLRVRERARIVRQDRELDAAIRLGTPVRTGPGSWRISVSAAPLTSVSYSVVCNVAPGSVLASADYVWISHDRSTFLNLTCPCATAECPPPNVTIHEVRRPLFPPLRIDGLRALD